MSDTKEKPEGSALVRVLAIVAAALACAMVLGGIVALATGSRDAKLARESALAQGSPAAASLPLFREIGTVRASTRDDPPAVVVVSVFFPYDPAAVPFLEELKRQRPRLQAACLDFFSTKSLAELHPSYEGALKAALRDRLNALLSLGAIQELYFSDYAVLE